MANLFTSDPKTTQLMQEGLLEGIFLDPVVLETMYRMRYTADPWTDKAVEKVMTRSGVMDTDLAPLSAMVDPTLGTYDFEQWTAAIAPYGKSIATDMEVGELALASLLARDYRILGENAGQVVNKLSRYPLYNAGLWGQSVINTAGALGTAKPVDRINGFTVAWSAANSRFEAVSVSNPLVAYVWNIVGSNWDTVSVTGATPTTAGDAIGPGTLTLAVAYTHVQYDSIVSQHAAFIVRTGGGFSAEAIGNTDTLKLRDIRNAVGRLKTLGIPRHPDGYYHCDLSTTGVTQLRDDGEFQLMFRGAGMGTDILKDNPYHSSMVAVVEGCIIYENPSAPESDTIPTAFEPNGDKIACAPSNNAGVSMAYGLVTGRDGFKEYRKNTIVSSSAGFTGKVGNWQLEGDIGAKVDVNGIQMIMRAPLDALQKVITCSWHFTGAHVAATDFLAEKRGPAYSTLPVTSITKSRYKRAVVIEHWGG